MLLIAGLLVTFVWMGLVVDKFDRRAQLRLVGVVAALSLVEVLRMLA